MTEKTHIPSKRNRLAIAFHLMAFFVILLIWLQIMLQIESLPDIIPVHYNFFGLPDGHGSKENIYMLAAIATILFVITYFSGYLIRYLKRSKKNISEKELNQLDDSCNMLASVNVIIALANGYIVFRTIELANGAQGGLGIWFVSLFLILLFGVVAFYTIKIIQAEIKFSSR